MAGGWASPAFQRCSRGRESTVARGWAQPFMWAGRAASWDRAPSLRGRCRGWRLPPPAAASTNGGVGRDPPRGASGIAQLELRLAGVFGVVRDGAPLPDGELRSRKARTLLKLLAVERARLVSVDRIAEVLWAAHPPTEPAQHVATLVSRLRRVLGPDVIRGGRQGYQLAGGPDVVVDLDEAARLTGHAERELAAAPALACTAAGRAVELLSPGIALAEEPYAAWAEPARQELRGLLRRARHALAGASQATGDAGLAARVAGDAMADDPFDEGAHRLFMSACAAGGERAKGTGGIRPAPQPAGRGAGYRPRAGHP